MPVVISDAVLRQAGLTENEALLEIACRLFALGRLDLWPAAQLAGLSRAEFERALGARGIPVYEPSIEDLEADLATLEKLRKRQCGS